jgi:hypothetical protein
MDFVRRNEPALAFTIANGLLSPNQLFGGNPIGLR